ncbi:membrane protein insertase YidC [Bartonella sp. HY329]|uniref:membrane protein insertase YidC n=1 Tax=unclassified Bartonella TaxID=2645622 RepID=UPI0021CAC80A|nr:MULTISPECIES: membrane protein insertase YidC [unclassified Bartonella]UXM94572.1 membrane protein insertase YidC [Bartonella sp. HY329]UXN08896.1 membrane protein insertase YidC [Bartonella sp. HY328]
MEYNRNFFIAIALSMAVIMGWSYFYNEPQNQVEQNVTNQAQKIEQEMARNPVGTVPIDNDTNSVAGTAGTNQPTGSVEMTPQAREAIVSDKERIAIDTPNLKGSINLYGAKLDDLLLKKYQMTVDKNSPLIALLNPTSFKEGYIAEFGFSSDPGVTLKLANNNALWKVEGENNTLTPQTPVALSYDNGEGLIFHRTISVDDEFMFTFDDTVTNNSDKPVSIHSYGRVMRVSPPSESNANYLLHEGLIGILGNLNLQTKSYTDLSKAEPLKQTIPFEQQTGGWIGITDKYWAVAVVPDQKTPYISKFSYIDNNGTRYQSEFERNLTTIAPGTTQSFQNHAFAGAKQVAILDRYESQLHIDRFGLLIDWGLLGLIVKPMFTLIDWLYKLVGNFGIAILLATVILKTILFPLANKSYKSMARMKVVQPAMVEIREKYAEDKTKQQQAIMELYRKEKINPLAGCWPILIQIPIFFALYKVLYITIEMRHAPFFGWIQDLAARDPTSLFNLFGLLPYHVPDFMLIGVWPIIMGITMFIQMRMNPTPPDPTQAMIFTWMPLVFTYMLAAFPAGLVIYWAWNNTLSVIQQGIIMKRQGVKIELFDNLKSVFKKKPVTASATNQNKSGNQNKSTNQNNKTNKTKK